MSSGARRGALFVFGPPALLLPVCLWVAAIELMRDGGRLLRVFIGLTGLILGLSTTGALVAASGDPSSWGVLGKTAAAALVSSLGRPAAYVVVSTFFVGVVSVGFGIPLWQMTARVIGRIERRLRRSDKNQASVTSQLSEPDGTAAQDSEDDGSSASARQYETAQSENQIGATGDQKRSSRRDGKAGDRKKGRLESSGQLELRLSDDGAPHPSTSYTLPPLTLLREGSSQQPAAASLEETGRVLVETLAQFDVEATLSGITPGPTVTRFEVELAPGVKVAKVKGLSDDIAYALAAESVRIQAPIPGKSAIGIEIPNRERRLVTVGDVLRSPAGRSARHPLDCALGKDISGKPVLINLAEMPHLLIAGTTGGGKSSTINALVTSLIMRNGPEQVRLLLVDPKRVELGVYDGIPHLLTHVVTNPKRASEALAWVVREMELRYEKLAELGARDISSYNSMVSAQGGSLAGETFTHEVMGYVVVVVDELNDLMMVAARDVEDSIMRLAQMARAVGIHLVIATQRPSTNVITGVIKANIPSRIAFKVGSQVDSRVILDTGGAEELVGMGDMLLLTASSGIPRRIQGCFVSEEEVRKIVGHWRRQVPEPRYLDDAIFTNSESETVAHDDHDELLEQAMDLVVQTQLGSTSMLQRKLRIGFARAGRLMDLLERRGVVGPSEGSKARAVLVSPEEYAKFKERQSVDDRNELN